MGEAHFFDAVRVRKLSLLYFLRRFQALFIRIYFARLELHPFALLWVESRCLDVILRGSSFLITSARDRADRGTALIP